MSITCISTSSAEKRFLPIRVSTRLLLLCLSVHGIALSGEPSPELRARRIHRHLLIGDRDSAIEEGRRYVDAHPDSQELRRAYLEALCSKGEEMEALRQFSFLSKNFPEATDLSRLSERLAWGVLTGGERSPLPTVRLYSLLGAAFTQDARALPILLKEMRGSNAFLRSLAVKLSTNYGDEPLREELLRLLKEEKVWFVKIEAIKAVGALRIVEAKPLLREIVAKTKSSAEEKAAAVLASVMMYDAVSREELSGLLSADRAGLRRLGSELIAHFNLASEADLLIPLLKDDSPDVRIAAMTALGLLRVETLQGVPTFSYLGENLNGEHPSVAITAGWLAAVLGKKEGLDVLECRIDGDVPSLRREASAALGATGHFGSETALKKLRESQDPYVLVNLSTALIGQRKETAFASDLLFSVISSSENDLWMWEEGSSSIFRSLAPGTVDNSEGMPGYPRIVDGLTKLELLSCLSIVKHPKALQAVKQFLIRRDFGLTGAAVGALLEEGGDDALVLVERLLDDQEPRVRVQAALILATFANDPRATKELIDSYRSADKNGKIHILEALGSIKDPAVVPFLLQVLEEPFQGLRVVAASSLIRHLYQ